MDHTIIQPKRPGMPGWQQVDATLPVAELTSTYTAWVHPASGLSVISAVEVAAEERGMPSLGPAYHLSIGLRGQRCTSADALWVLAQFDLTDALEDNHVPSGRVRNFWRYVADNLSGSVCPCNDREPVIREDKGDYVWRGITT